MLQLKFLQNFSFSRENLKNNVELCKTVLLVIENHQKYWKVEVKLEMG